MSRVKASDEKTKLYKYFFIYKEKEEKKKYLKPNLTSTNFLKKNVSSRLYHTKFKDKLANSVDPDGLCVFLSSGKEYMLKELEDFYQVARLCICFIPAFPFTASKQRFCSPL